MKKTTTLLAFLLAFSAFLSAQTKKYPLLQHFTNSQCGVCASKNPAFFTQIAGQNDLHHLAIHPKTPYSSCVFYQANTSENQFLADQYSVTGTPRMVVNGALLPVASALLSQTQMTTAQAQTSPIWIGVNETVSGASVKVDVTIQTVSTPPAGDWKLFVAAAEKTINQTTGNGEAVHHNVLRDLLPGSAGEAITIPAVGQVATFSFTYDIKAAWTASEMYALAWVQNLATKEVLNSGTRFDPVAISTTQVVDNQRITLAPNPATDEISITLGSQNAAVESVEIYSLAGQKMAFQPAGLGSKKATANVESLPKGTYLVRAKTSAGTATGKFVKI